MANPFLYTHFEILRAYIDKDTILGDILSLLDQVSENIPEDQEQAMYYVLGACSLYVNEISQVLNHTNIFLCLLHQKKPLTMQMNTLLAYKINI